MGKGSVFDPAETYTVLAKWFWTHFTTERDDEEEERMMFVTFFKLFTETPLPPKDNMVAWFRHYIATLANSSFEYGLRLLEVATEGMILLHEIKTQFPA